jgi:hypothetical protein
MIGLEVMYNRVKLDNKHNYVRIWIFYLISFGSYQYYSQYLTH